MGIQINGNTDTVTSTTAGGSVTVTPLAASGGLNVGTGASISSPATNVLTLGTNSVEALRIDSSGNIGVNSTSPSAIVGSGKILNISNTGHATISIQAIDSTNDRNSVLELLSSGNGGSESKIVYGDTDTTPGTSSPLVFYGRHSGTTTEKLRITSSGNLGIGTNNPTGNGDQTTIHVHAADYPVLHLTNSTTGTAASDGSELTLNADGSLILRNRENSFIRFDTNGSERVRIDSSGRVTMPYQPCFQASGNQATTYTAQVVPFNVSLTNNGSNYSTSTYRFTAPVAGHYFFTLHAILGPDGGNSAQLHMRRNGTRVATVHRNTSTSTLTWEQGACSAVLYLNVSDYVDCYIESGTIYLGSNITGGEVYSALNGYLIG